VLVTDIELDASWVGGYAKLTADSAGALAEGVKTMGMAPLAEESFGQLGRQLGTPQAYGKAAQLLRAQLGRAVESLTAASDGLEKVTSVYVDTDEESGKAIKQELR
jgi:hypothetical protein